MLPLLKRQNCKEHEVLGVLGQARLEKVERGGERGKELGRKREREREGERE